MEVDRDLALATGEELRPRRNGVFRGEDEDVGGGSLNVVDSVQGEGEDDRVVDEDMLPSDGGWWDGEEQGSSEWGLTDGDSMSASEAEIMLLGDRPSGMSYILF